MMTAATRSFSAMVEPSASSQTLSPSIRSAPTSPNRSNALECDYDTNPSFLYQAVEARQWTHVREFLEQNDQAHLQASTWVVRKEVDGKLRWRLLPLHAAVIFGSPLEVIELLLAEYPAAAQSKDDQGMLPLHLSFRNFQSWEILEELLTAYPQAISVKDRKGRTPLQCSCSKFKQPASVLELYTHVAVTSEKLALSRLNKTTLDAQIGALQETHIQTLERLKNDWQERSEELEQQLVIGEQQYIELQKECTSAKLELKARTESEQELTLKLTQVTEALTEANECMAAVGIDNDDRMRQLQSENKVLRGAIQELLEKQQKMQTMLATLIDKEAQNVKARNDKVEALRHELEQDGVHTTVELVLMQQKWQSLSEGVNQQLSQLQLTGHESASAAPVSSAIPAPVEETPCQEGVDSEKEGSEHEEQDAEGANQAEESIVLDPTISAPTSPVSVASGPNAGSAPGSSNDNPPLSETPHLQDV